VGSDPDTVPGVPKGGAQPETNRGATVTTPRNRLTRDQRVAQWNAAREAGKTFRPHQVIGKGARNSWLRAVGNPAGDISATARLVRISLALNGNPDGSRIYPGIRLLARQCNLSQRAICEALDTLVRRGFLLREWKVGNAAGCGFRYVLTIPDVLTQGAQFNGAGADAGCTPAEVPTHGAHGAHPGADRCAPWGREVLTQGAPTSSYQSMTTERTPAPAGRKARGRALREESPEVQHRRKQADALAPAASNKPPTDETPK